MSAGKAFVDTNVLLYMYAETGDAKKTLAQQLYEDLLSHQRLLLSTQVVQEFYRAGQKKLRVPKELLRRAAGDLLGVPLVIVGPEHIRSAFDIEQRYGIAFWDALIVASAEAGGARIIYTEDLNDGQRYGDVVARNPFRSN